MKRFISVIIFMGFYAWTTVQAASMGFRSIYAFGDSLSDIGNVYNLTGGMVPPETRFDSGRFSNGKVWVDELAAMLRLKRKGFFPSLDPRFEIGPGGGSYAYGASGTDFVNGTPLSERFPVSVPVVGLLGQVEEFALDIGPTQADQRALYIVWSGANDYLLAGIPGSNIPFPPNPYTTVEKIRLAAERLHELGAKHLLVLNMPDLSNTPIAAALDQQTPGVQERLRTLTNAHNTLLRQGMESLDTTSEDLRLYYLDVFSLFEVIDTYPAGFGFSNTFTDPGPAANCLIQISSEPQDCDSLPDGFDASGSMLWDAQHPTTQLHKFIAATAVLCLKIPRICELRRNHD